MGRAMESMTFARGPMIAITAPGSALSEASATAARGP